MAQFHHGAWCRSIPPKPADRLVATYLKLVLNLLWIFDRSWVLPEQLTEHNNAKLIPINTWNVKPEHENDNPQIHEVTRGLNVLEHFQLGSRWIILLSLPKYYLGFE